MDNGALLQSSSFVHGVGVSTGGGTFIGVVGTSPTDVATVVTVISAVVKVKEL